jgi:hypothetical protein
MKLQKWPAPAVCAALLLCLAACSGGGSSSKPAAASEPTSGPAAAAVIKARWLKVFDANIPILRRLNLLQNGQAFASFVKAQEKTTIGSLVLEASGTVSSVTVHPNGRASVVYTILLAGKPLESDITGTAVYTGGSWKVATSTFCGLLDLAYGKKSGQIPHACGTP